MDYMKSLFIVIVLCFVNYPSSALALTSQEQEILRKGGISEDRIRELNKDAIRPGLYDWNNDGLKDIIAGTQNGELNVYINIGSNDTPVFDERIIPDNGAIDAGHETVPSIVDWDNDGLKDVVMGNMDGTIYVYINNGSQTHPRFETERKLNDLSVGSFSSPAVVDWNGDGKKDLIVGNERGEILVYLNIGKDSHPQFNDPLKTKLKVPGRATPCIEYTNNGLFNIICGSSDGRVSRFVNKGTKGNPSFSPPEPITIGGKIIQMPGYTTVTVVDWDDDGKFDLLISYAEKIDNTRISSVSLIKEPARPDPKHWDGRTAFSLNPKSSGTYKVYLLRNTGTNQNPEFKEGVEILRSKFHINL